MARETEVVEQTDDAIREMYCKLADRIDRNVHTPGKTYEQGMDDMLEWITSEFADNPLD